MWTHSRCPCWISYPPVCYHNIVCFWELGLYFDLLFADLIWCWSKAGFPLLFFFATLRVAGIYFDFTTPPVLELQPKDARRDMGNLITKPHLSLQLVSAQFHNLCRTGIEGSRLDLLFFPPATLLQGSVPLSSFTLRSIHVQAVSPDCSGGQAVAMGTRTGTRAFPSTRGCCRQEEWLHWQSGFLL